ncbi:hypothetical protein LIA77_01401 [Sarocladium implicatum]|nr:hypothetical protein LIA77_01401 [Sarocladium implicatum]
MFLVECKTESWATAFLPAVAPADSPTWSRQASTLGPHHEPSFLEPRPPIASMLRCRCPSCSLMTASVCPSCARTCRRVVALGIYSYSRPVARHYRDTESTVGSDQGAALTADTSESLICNYQSKKSPAITVILVASHFDCNAALRYGTRHRVSLAAHHQSNSGNALCTNPTSRLTLVPLPRKLSKPDCSHWSRTRSHCDSSLVQSGSGMRMGVEDVIIAPSALTSHGGLSDSGAAPSSYGAESLSFGMGATGIEECHPRRCICVGFDMGISTATQMPVSFVWLQRCSFREGLHPVGK